MFFIALVSFHFASFSAPTQDEIDSALRTQALAEATKATAEANKFIAEAQIAETRAKLGVLDLSKLSPTRAEAKTLDIETNLVAYQTIRLLAEQIITAIKPNLKGKTVVIYSDADFKSIEQLRFFSSNLRDLNADIAGLTIPNLVVDNSTCPVIHSDREAGGGSLGILGSIDAVTQVLSLFKVNKNLEGSTINVDSYALSVAIMDRLIRNDITVIYPPLFFSGGAFRIAEKSQIEKDFTNLSSAALRVDQVTGTIAVLKQKIAARVGSGSKKSANCNEAIAISTAILSDFESRAKIIKSRAEKYIALASVSDEATGKTFLQTLITAEALRTAASNGMILQLKPIFAGGTTITKTSYFTSSIRVSAGAIVSYVLVSGDNGQVINSGVTGRYGGFLKLEDLASQIKD
jgi:hypothetical protein